MPGVLPPGGSVSVELSVTAAGNGTRTVTGEVLAFSRPTAPGIPATDVDSTPDQDATNDVVVDDAIDGERGDEDDHDVATFTVVGEPRAALLCAPRGRAPDLALLVTGPRSIRVGRLATLRIIVLNQGHRVAHDVRVAAHVATRGALAVPAGRNGQWRRSAPGRVERRIALLPAGRQAVLLLHVRARRDTAGRLLRTVAEIASARDVCGRALGDVDSTPDVRAGNDRARVDNAVGGQRGDEDDHDWVRMRVRR